MSKLRALFVIPLVALAVTYGWKIPTYLDAHSEKHGRVVDEATNEGIEGAAVIATSTMTCSGGSLVESHIAADTEYRLLVRTDSSGNYRVPATYRFWDPGHLTPVPGVCHEDWSLEAFKPGFVLKQDADRWAEEAQRDIPVGTRLTTVELRPETSWNGVGLHLTDIRLVARSLPIEDAATYYAAVMNAGGFAEGQSFTDDERTIRKAATDYFMTEVCALDPDMQLDWSDPLSALVSNRRAFIVELSRLEPDGFKKAGESGRPAVFTARSVCKALGAAKG